jgi:hypothetical protein
MVFCMDAHLVSRDRMLIFGTLPKICFAGGMTSFLYERKIRIFDYPKFAEPFRNRIRENAEKMAVEGRRYSGFNLFDPDDENLLCSIVRGEFNIGGLQNKTLRLHLPELNSGQVSRLLKRLRTHGLVKKVGHTYKYYVTAFGKEVVATALKLRELVIIPQFALGLAQ